MAYIQQLKAFLYKDLFIRKVKRHYVLTLLELALSITLLGLSVYMRTRGTSGAVPVIGGVETFKPLNCEYLGALSNQTVAYAPTNNFTNDLIGFLNSRLGPGSFRPVKFDSWKQLQESLQLKNTTRLVLNLENVSKENLSYTISLDLPGQNSHMLFPRNPAPRHQTIETVYTLPLLWNIFQFYTKYFHDLDVSPPVVQPMPTGEYLEDNSFLKIIRYISQLILFSYVVFVGYFPTQIIQEKASRIRELLRMMGQNEIVYWHGLLIVGLVCMGFTAAVTAITFAIPFGGHAVFVKSDPLLVFLLLIAFSITTILHLILVSVIFNGPAMGALVSILLWFFGTILSSIWMDSETSNNYISLAAHLKLMSLFLPPCSCYWSFKLVGFWEMADIGAQFSNLNRIAFPGDNITLLHILLVNLNVWLVYAFFIFYLDAVIPWQYGIPKHPLFLFKRSYWLPRAEPAETKPTEGSLESSELLESVSDTKLETVVELVNVSKYFAGKKRVLDNLSLKFFKNQISVILGHNGAGKTTTMNILTGLFPPSSGNMYINGFSVRDNTKKARESVGLCPQHNVLFDDLTVEEHLRYFSALKQKTAQKIEEDILDLLAKFDLTRKRSTLSKHLSGGMKRKLSMANAMIGGPKVLILDEPTAGMDPQARRAVWNILQEARKSCSILLTTHYMEEADVLGDRIAFLTAGRLRCAGSPMFLKKKFDTGYKMRVGKVSPGTDIRPILGAITTRLDGAVLEANTNQEFCVNLGFPSTGTLVNLFSHLEDSKQDLGFSNLGVSVTTMEDVFLKVGAAVEEASISDSLSEPSLSSVSLSSESDVAGSFPHFDRITGFNLICSQFCALFMKRYRAIKRQWWMPCFLFVLPILLTVLFCHLDEWAYSTQLESDIHYSLKDMYDRTEGWISAAINKSDLFAPLKKFMAQEDMNFAILPEMNFTEYLINKSYEDPLNYRMRMMMGVDYETAEAGDRYRLWLNTQPYHSEVPVTLEMQRSIFESLTGQTLNLDVTSHPRYESKYKLDTIYKLFWVRLVTIFPASLTVAFITCPTILHPIEENISRIKLLQLMTGLRRAVYFGSSFAFDVIMLVSSVATVLATLLICNPLSSFTVFSDTWQAVLVLFLLYGYATIPLSYILSYSFRKPSTGFLYLLVFNVITGSLIVVVMALFDMLSILDNKLFNLDVDAINISLHILNYVPAFSVVWGFVNIHVNGLAKSFCETTPQKLINEFCPLKRTAYFIRPCCNNCSELTSGNATDEFCFVHKSPFMFDQKESAGCQMLALFIVGTVLFAVLILVETRPHFWLHRVTEKLWKIPKTVNSYLPDLQLETEDVDVSRERETTNRVSLNSADRNKEALVVHGLTKYYGNYLAVDRLTFRVHHGECFGLLGVNGAGKSTTFGMLTGDVAMSGGNAFIDDSNVRRSIHDKNIGYCPQFNAIINVMSGRELLQLFCSLRGVPRSRNGDVVDFFIDIVGLKPHADKASGSYSGGNKRKLSIALALIGNPRVILLDEPTAGVDPSARRKIWNALARAQKDIGSAFILTSHSMEECEALCHRLCIMVKGRLRCLGSTQHLKSKFGKGFVVLVKLRPGRSHEAADVLLEMEKMFPANVVLREHHQNLMQFHVTDTLLRWSTLFKNVDAINEKFHFEDVLVSDTTLEQIFLSFAKMQEDSDPDGVSEITTP